MQIGMILACVAGFMAIIGFLDDLTCHSNNLFSTAIGLIYKTINAAVPVILPILGAYPIVVLIFWWITTFTNINIAITY